MDRRFRRSLFGLFTLTFLVAAPTLIVTTAGYRYNFVKGRLERTGVLFVSTKPADAGVEVNGDLRKEKTPARIKGLLPGTYHVRVVKDGHHPWERTIEVRSRETTFLNNVTLFLRGIPSLAAEAEAESASFSPDRRFAALVVREPSYVELRIVDLRTGEAHLPYRTETAEETELAFRWSPDSARLLIERRGGSRPSFHVWDPARPLETSNLADVPPSAYESAFWSEEGRFVYASSEGRLYRLDVAARTALDSGPSSREMRIVGASVFGLFRDAGETLLVRRPLTDDAFTVLGPLPDADYRLVPGASDRIAYLAQGRDRIVIADPSSDPGALTYVELRGLDGEWDPTGARFLYWNDLELRVYDAGANADRLITRIGTAVADAEWLSEDGTIAYADGKNALVAEPDIGFGRAPLVIARFTSLERVASSPDGRTTWFLGSIGGRSGLWTLRVR